MVRHAFQTKTFSFRKRRFAWPPIKEKRVHKRTVKSNPPNATQLWDEYKTLWRFRTCRNYTEQNSSPRLSSHSSNYSFFFFVVALDVASLQSHTKQPRNLRARVPLKCNEFSPLALCFLKENCAAKISMNTRHAHACTDVCVHPTRGVRVSATGNCTMVTRKPQLMCSRVDNASPVMRGPCIPIVPAPVSTPISSRLKEDYSIFLVYWFIRSLRCGASVVGKMAVIRKR